MAKDAEREAPVTREGVCCQRWCGTRTTVETMATNMDWQIIYERLRLIRTNDETPAKAKEEVFFEVYLNQELLSELVSRVCGRGSTTIVSGPIMIKLLERKDVELKASMA